MSESDSETPKREDEPEHPAGSEEAHVPEIGDESLKPELPDAEAYQNQEVEPEEVSHDVNDDVEDHDPFEAVATGIEENLQGGKRRLGSEGDEMSFLEHLEDLRGTIFRCVIAFLVMSGVMMCFLPYIADALEWPLSRAYGSIEEARKNLITHRPMEVFTVIIQVVFLGALALSLPAMLYFVAQFVAPGLTDKELGVLRPGCFAAFFLFIVGAAFAYFLILPPALYFSIKFNRMLNFDLLWSAGDYYSMVVWLSLGVGALFQFPLILILLCYVGILSATGLRQSRRIVVVIVLVVAALITPGGDPFTLLLLSVPLYGLFEASVLMAAFLEKRQQAELAKSD